MKILNLPITSRKNIAEGAFEVHLGLGENTFPFLSGQYIRLTIPELLKPDPKGNYRDFSIVSAPDNIKEIVIALRSSKSGFKKSLLELPEGAVVKVTGPFGESIAQRNGASPLVMIAGGIGITPILSTIRTLAESGAPGEVLLLYGNKDVASSAYLEELKDIQKKHKFFKFKNKIGYIDAPFIAENIKHLYGSGFFMAGPSKMVESVGDILLGLGVSSDKIFAVDFLGYEAGSSRLSVITSKDHYIESGVSKDDLSGLLEALNKTAGVSKTSATGTIIYANDKFLETSKYDRDELMGQNHRILKSGHHPAEFYKDLWNTISEGRVWRGELKDRAKDGSIYWVDSSIAPILDENGRIINYISIFFPVTEKKEREESLKAENEIYFKQIAETIPEVFFVVSSDSRQMLYISPSYEKIWGRTVKSLYENPKSWVDSIHPDDQAYVIEEVFQKKYTVPFTLDYRIIGSENKMRWIYTKVFPVLDSKGEVIRQIGIAEDRTAQKETEEVLRKSEEKFRQIADNIKEIFFLLDPVKPEILYVSPAFEEVFGKKVGMIYLDSFAWLAQIVPQDRDRIEASFKNILNEIKGGGIEEHFKINRGNGEVRDLRARLFGIKNESGAIYRVAGIVEDVTDVISAEEAQKNREIQKIKEEFFFHTIHDLRAPSNVIRMVMDEYSDPDKFKSNPKRMQESANMVKLANERMIKLVQGLLEVAKGVEIVYKKEKTDISGLIRNVIREFGPALEKKSITVNYVSAGEVPPVIADQDKLSEAISNLIDNGIKYNKQGGSLNIAHEIYEGYLKTMVQDTGIGIDEKYIQKLFTPYFRAGQDENVIGTGLGLYIVKNLIEKMNGGIEVASKPGEGTTFMIFLPLAE